MLLLLLLVHLALALAGGQLGLRLRQLLAGCQASAAASRRTGGQMLCLAHDQRDLVGDRLQSGHRQFVRYVLQVLFALERKLKLDYLLKMDISSTLTPLVRTPINLSPI